MTAREILHHRILQAIESEMKKDEDGFYCLYKGNESHFAAKTITEIVHKELDCVPRDQALAAIQEIAKKVHSYAKAKYNDNCECEICQKEWPEFFAELFPETKPVHSEDSFNKETDK